MSAQAHCLGLIPHPQVDETLSSFILRLARNQSAIPHELCSLIWPGLQFWPRDIDRTASDELIKRVAMVTGLPILGVKAMTLHGLVDGMGHNPTRTGIQNGILPVGVYHRMRRRFGQQYCPECLRQSPAYLRRLWRLEFVTACPVHGCRLFDACPHCGAPFVPHRLDSLLGRRCHQCHQTLIEGAESVNRHALQVQEGLSALLYRKIDAVCARPKEWGIPASHHELFDGIRRLCRLLTYSADGRGLQPHRPGLRWDYLRVREREIVLSHVGTWLDDWPTSFRAWAEGYQVSQQRMGTVGPWPRWIAVKVASLPSRPHSKKRPSVSTIAGLKRELGNSAAYRMARARLLLDRVEMRQAIL